MKNWQPQDAKARFSELLNITLKAGPQVVTRRVIAAAVLVPIEEWRCLLDSSVRAWRPFYLVPARALKTSPQHAAISGDAPR